LDEFTKEGEARNHHLPIRGDKRAKPNKYLRIENMSPLFERGLIRISEDIRQSPDTVEFIDQLLGFPFGHDDAPDALEGALYYTARTSRSSGFTPRSGKFSNKSKYKA
jgi:predicted phage terminase large subunit-like protein